ncbi:MAG: outer membrane beta-barrel protein [Crocinitomicaceae bacterium]
MLKNFLLIILYPLFGHSIFAQVGMNLPNFDRRKFHIGASLSLNTADYRYQFSPGVYNGDSINYIQVNKTPGFTFAMVGSLDISPLFHLRFLPGFSITERVFNYGELKNNELVFSGTRLESFFLDFPLILKLRTKRINNFAAYGITGVQYGLDLATQSGVETVPGERIMKMKRHDFSSIFGGGFDFFMMYYKLSLEVKINNGFKDLLIQEHTFFSSPLSSLKTKVWTFSIIFEG